MPRPRNPLPSQEELRQRFDYDPVSGDLHLIVPRKREGRPRKDAVSYRLVRIGDSFFHEHRLVWVWHYGEMPEGMLIDHIDRNPSNNRIENLRLATYAQNSANSKTRARGVSGFKGVSPSPGGDGWIAYIRHERKHYHLGTFRDKMDAVAAVKAKRDELQGSFAQHGALPDNLPENPQKAVYDRTGKRRFRVKSVKILAEQHAHGT